MTAATTLVALVLLNACDDFGTGRDVSADGCESFVHSITRSALIWPVCFVALDGGERQHLPLGGGRGLLRRGLATQWAHVADSAHFVGETGA